MELGRDGSRVPATAFNIQTPELDPAPPTPAPPHKGEGISVRAHRYFHLPSHCFTSIADLSPSDKRLNEIEVMKIMAPGRAATQGWT